jgi:hypothetical protein
MGPSFLSARLVEGALWVFAAAGVLFAPPRAPGDAGTIGVRPVDVMAVVLVIGLVRIMARGIALTP